MAKYTTAQLESIQLDYGIVYADYGEAGERLLGPTRGGATFDATQQVRDIEFDGRNGKSKGLQAIDFIDAKLAFASLAISKEDLQLAMPYLKANSIDPNILECTPDSLGLIPASAYFANITVFGKVVGGGYKRISVFNAMNEAPFGLAAVPKGEGLVNLEVFGHWETDTASTVDKLFDIEDVATLGADTTPPTVTTVPADAATAVVVSNDLTATFSKAIREGDITLTNFILIKASDGTLVAGAISYVPATKTATFNPTASLGAATAYIWAISNVRDTAGNKMATAAINFTTA